MYLQALILYLPYLIIQEKTSQSKGVSVMRSLEHCEEYNPNFSLDFYVLLSYK